MGQENKRLTEMTDTTDLTTPIDDFNDETIEIQENTNNIISDNLIFLNWYFKEQNIDILHDNEKQRIFSFLTYSMLEDPYCFLRIMLYIANTRKTDKQEILYKIIIHFLGTMFPEIVMANLELFIKLGKKDDVLYFLQCPGITERVITWIKHKAKEDMDFKILLDGKMIGTKIKRVIRYKPKLTKDSKWDIFLFKILDDTTFNGITV